MTSPFLRLALCLCSLACLSTPDARAADASKDRPPQLFRQRPPVHPESIANFRVRGEVRVTLDVGADGTVSNVRAGYATHPDFVAPAIAAVLDWRYRPALRDGQPVPTYDLKANVISDVVVLGGPAFSIPPRGSDLLPPAFRYDEPPSIRIMMPVVYPYEILAGGLPGRASVAFAVGPDGRVEDVSVVRATHPDFGEALAAAMESWEFEPARYAGQPFAALLARSLDFNPEGKDMPINDTTRRLLFESRKPNPAFVDVADLDEMPATRFGATPRYPGRMGGEAGEAEIEFIIDRTGRVHLPRIVSASAPPFGWAAVTAAAQWEFSPPRKGGQPVDARMRVPVQFPAQPRSSLSVIPAVPVVPAP